MAYIGAERYRGARIILSSGRAELLPAQDYLDEGWVRPVFSVLSPGTERRHLAALEHRPAGYMTAGISRGRMLLSAAPHGAWFRDVDSSNLVTQANAEMQTVAFARFQLMAALGLERVPVIDHLAVVGSGPVGLACALEGVRRAVDVVLVTKRTLPGNLRSLGIEVVSGIEPACCGLVIDCTGRDPNEAARLVAAHGTFGLLGTPPSGSALDALAVHRRSISVVGMHELTGQTDDHRQRTFNEVLAWLDDNGGRVPLNDWIEVRRGAEASDVFRQVAELRLSAPLVVFTW